MAALAYSQFCYQDALAAGFCSCKTCISAIPGGHTCADLSSQCNAESALDVSPRPAGPVVPSRVVVVLAKGVAIPCVRRLAAEHDRLPQSGHILVQRAPSQQKYPIKLQQASQYVNAACHADSGILCVVFGELPHKIRQGLAACHRHGIVD